jgi:PilZ domain-containing protein
MDKRQRSRRHHSRKDVSWTAWVKVGSRRLRCHTVDLSANGTKLKPRAEMPPGTAVELQLQPPDGHPVNVAGLVWRLDTDGMAVMFLRNIPVQFTGSGTRPENGRRGWR